MALVFTDGFEYADFKSIHAKWLGGIAEKAGYASDAFQGVAMALKGVGQQGQQVKTGVDYGKHLTAKPVTGSVSTSKSVSGKEIASSATESETVHPGVFSDGMSITVEGGRVLNLGNYETARVGVSITVPCSKDTLEEAYTYATGWLSEKIEEAVKLAKE